MLCDLFLPRLRPKPDNFFVRALLASYLRQLQRCLRHRWITLGVFAALVAATAAAIPMLGREFMPELEEGNLWIQAQFPLNSSLEEVCALSQKAHEILKHCPEAECVLTQVGRPDDGTDPAGFYNAEFFLPLKPHGQWPVPPGTSRPRTKQELTAAVAAELHGSLIAVEWNFSQNIRNMVMESLSGVRGENSVKIIGPDLQELEHAADRVVKALKGIQGLEDVGAYRIMGQSNLTLPIDRQKCARWNLKVGDVQAVVDTAVGGKPFSQMIEGERNFDITLRFAQERRADLDAILNIPVEVGGNTVASSQSPGQSATPVSGSSTGPSPTGSNAAMPALSGSGLNATLNDLGRTPHRRLGDLVTPQDPDGRPNPHGSFVQQGASDIYRDQGERLIAIKFDIHGRDLAGAVAEAKRKTKDLIHAPCRLEWSGEFQEMEQAESRMMIVIPLAMAAVVVLLVSRLPLAGRRVDRALQRGGPVLRRHLGPAADAYELQHLGRRGIHLDLWRRRHERPFAGILVPSAAAGRRADGGSHLARSGPSSAAHDDDHADGDLWPRARGAFHPHRRAEPASLGHRGDRWYDDGAPAEPIPDAGALQRSSPPATVGRVGRLGRVTGAVPGIQPRPVPPALR